MTKHTPGPWWVGHHAITGVFAERKAGTISIREAVVASCGGFSTNTDQGEHCAENEANARLIAAAPDLLEAAKMYVGSRGSAQGRVALSLLRAAIAKATGEDQ